MDRQHFCRYRSRHSAWTSSPTFITLLENQALAKLRYNENIGTKDNKQAANVIFSESEAEAVSFWDSWNFNVKWIPVSSLCLLEPINLRIAKDKPVPHRAPTCDWRSNTLSFKRLKHSNVALRPSPSKNERWKYSKGELPGYKTTWNFLTASRAWFFLFPPLFAFFETTFLTFHGRQRCAGIFWDPITYRSHSPASSTFTCCRVPGLHINYYPSITYARFMPNQNNRAFEILMLIC